MRALVRLFAAAAAILILLARGPGAQAAVIINIDQVGSDVVTSTTGGPINLNALTPVDEGPTAPQLVPNAGVVVLGDPAFNYYDVYQGITGPSSFGSGGSTIATSGSGAGPGVAGAAHQIYVPVNFISNTALVASSNTYTGQTISSLGLTPGTYVWTWGTGPSADSFTVNVHPGTTPVPLPSSLAGGLIGLAMLVRPAHRRRADRA
jgi:hypothetical protein